MSQELHIWDTKHALLTVENYAVLLQPAEHLPKELHMLLRGPAPDQHIVYVDKAVVKALQYLVHKALEALACAAQPKWHADKLPQSERGDDCGIWHVLQPYRNLVETLDGDPAWRR